MNRWPLLLGLLFCSWSALASLSGDVNGDGAVDVADLERARKIASGALEYEAAADVDGDSAVTEIDLWLIKEAVLGRPIPELVRSAVIGSSGGTLSHGNITVTFAPGAAQQTHVSLFRCENELLDEDSPLHDLYLVAGLSTNLAGFTVSYNNCGNNMGLCAGSYTKPYDAAEMRWQWLAFPEAGFIRNGSALSRVFPTSSTSDMGISHSMKLAIVTANAPPPLSQVQSAPVAPISALSPLSVSGSKYAGYKYTGWRSSLYHVYTKDWGTISYADLEALCNQLHAIHNKIEAMGFPLSTTHGAKFPLEVYVIQGMKDDGCFVENPVTGNKWIELNAKLLAMPNELKATLGHELMHYTLEAYQGGNGFAFANIEDAITTWFEAVASDNPEHRSGNYTSRPAAPLKSLFAPITRTWRGSQDWSTQEQHGYGTSAFIDYHFDNHRGHIFELAQKVSGGQTIEEALNTLFKEKYGALYDLERKYLEFVRDYLMSKANCYSSTLNPDAIFASDSSTDLERMYKLIAIKQASTNLFEKERVDFKVQDYGCGVVQFKIFKPDRIFAPQTQLRVTAPKFCKSVDLLMESRGEDGVTHSEIVTGVYGQNAEGQDEWSCAITLPDDVIYILLSALVTVGNHGKVSDYTETHDVAMTYQFEGDYYMPMQEMFVRYTEINSQSTYYGVQIYSDAILRIVDPIGEVGLDYFSVDRTTVTHAQPSVNYNVNIGFSSVAAWRRSPDAFQMRLFSDTSAQELAPFTINLNTDGYSPWTVEGQKPILAGDGSPKMAVMLYHVPIAALDQLIPGESTFRIQNITTSAHNMRQSADGQNGGVVIDIPAEITGYRCALYVFVAFENTEYAERTAFLISIDPMQEGGE